MILGLGTILGLGMAVVLILKAQGSAGLSKLYWGPLRPLTELVAPLMSSDFL